MQKMLQNEYGGEGVFRCRTNLKNIDFRTCNIEGITVNKDDLNGLIVNDFQAIELSKLLGIIVK